MTDLLWRCDRCPAVRHLMAWTVKGLLCSACWHALGQPAAKPATMHEVHAAEVAARDSMTRRGGTDRHLVRNGLS